MSRRIPLFLMLAVSFALIPAAAASAENEAASRETLRTALAACATEAGGIASPANLAATSAFAARMIDRMEPSGPARAIARRCWQQAVDQAMTQDDQLSTRARVLLAQCLNDAVAIEGAKQQRAALARLLKHLQEETRGEATPARAMTSAGLQGMVIAVLARGTGALGDTSYLEAAQVAAASLRPPGNLADGALLRTGDEAAHPFCADDYIGSIAGALALYQGTGESRWLTWAVALQDRLDRDFWDQVGKSYRTSETADSQGGREALNLVELATITDDDLFQERANALLVASSTGTTGDAASRTMLAALDQQLGPVAHLMIVGNPTSADAHAFVAAAHRTYQPRLVIVTYAGDPPQHELRTRFPAMVPSPQISGKATAYLCFGLVCTRPTTDPAELDGQLATVPYRWTTDGAATGKP